MMFKFKKFVSVLFFVLMAVTMFSIVSVRAITDFPDVPTSPPRPTEATRATEATRPAETATSAYIEATKPSYNTTVTVSSSDDEQDVYVENQPFNSTTNTAIIACAIEGGIICVCLIIIILLLSIRMLKGNKQKTQYQTP